MLSTPSIELPASAAKEARPMSRSVKGAALEPLHLSIPQTNRKCHVERMIYCISKSSVVFILLSLGCDASELADTAEYDGPLMLLAQFPEVINICGCQWLVRVTVMN